MRGRAISPFKPSVIATPITEHRNTSLLQAELITPNNQIQIPQIFNDQTVNPLMKDKFPNPETKTELQREKNR